jgi:hypothetical protein
MTLCQGFSAKTPEATDVFHSHKNIGVLHLPWYCEYFSVSDIIKMLTGG